MAGESKVQLVAVHTIVRKESKDSEEKRFAPGEVLVVPASEAKRLLSKGAAKRADEPEEEDEESEEGEEGETKKSSAKSRTKKRVAKGEPNDGEDDDEEGDAPQNPSIVS